MTDDQILKLIIFGIPLAWLITALIVGAWTRARGVVDDAATVRTYWVCCGQTDCTCGTGVGDQAEAWLRARGEQVYDWAEDEGSGLA